MTGEPRLHKFSGFFWAPLPTYNFYLYFRIVLYFSQIKMNWTERRIRTLRLFYFGDGSLCMGTCTDVDFVAHFPSDLRFFRRARNRRTLSIFFFYVVTLLKASAAQPMAIFAFDFVRNTHTEALMSLLSKSLAQATSYLVAVHLHDWCPSSIPTSKISHVTENGCWLWVKDNCNHLSFVCPRQRKHFLVNNCSETCIRRTLEHSLRVSKHAAGFSLFTLKKKKQFHNLV